MKTRFPALFVFLAFFFLAPTLADQPAPGRDAALKNGASLFAAYCLSCHGLSFVRYERLADLTFSAEEIQETMTPGHPGDPMRIAARPADQKLWFGALPPDLSLIARSRGGADWLNAYLRAFVRDESRPTGWNNTVSPNTAMPNVFWALAGNRADGVCPPKQGGLADEKSLACQPTAESAMRARALEPLSPAVFDRRVSELVDFLVWAGEPSAALRRRTGIGVLAFLLVFLALAYALKREYWTEIEKNQTGKD